MNNKHWIFKEFVDDRGVSEFGNWVRNQTIKDQAKIGAFIRRLEIVKLWNSKLICPLTNYAKIIELRIRGEKVQLRPLGCYGPERGEFTLLIGAIEKGSEFVPKDAPNRAEQKRFLVEKDGRRYTKYYE